MELTINLTLIVQIVHFLIAYVLISKFFLRPGYEAVKSDENRLRQIRSLIEEEQQHVAAKELKKRSRWQACQQYFHKNRPIVETQSVGLVPLSHQAPFPEPSEKELKELAHDVSMSLKEKMLHD